MKNVMLLVLAGLLVGTGFFFSATLYPARAEAQQTSATTCRTGMISGSYVYSIQDTIIFSPPFPPGPAALVGGFQADGHGNLLHGQDHANFAGTPLDRTFSFEKGNRSSFAHAAGLSRYRVPPSSTNDRVPCRHRIGSPHRGFGFAQIQGGDEVLSRAGKS